MSGYSMSGYPAVTTGNSTVIYPCDMNTGRPMGWHHFEASPNGITVCRYCGKRP